MKRVLWILILAACANPSGPKRPLYLVGLKHGMRAPASISVRSHYSGGFIAELSDAEIASLHTNPAVRYIEPDQTYHMTTDSESVTFVGAWGLDRIDQRNLPLDTWYHWTTDASGVNAYIFDTGIRQTHVDFGGRAIGAYTAFDDGNGTNDCNGHGTHVAGIIGGTAWGVAKGVNLKAVRVLDCNGFGTTVGIVDAITWLDTNAVKPAVVNMSLDGPFSQALNDAITSSQTQGILYVVAAGNDSSDACNFSPASTPVALTIGATTRFDEAWPYSNTGSCVDLLAPGVNITSDFFTSDTAIGTLSGTSVSTPFVTGTAAILLQNNPAAIVDSLILANATSGTLTGTGSTTPNLLLYTAVPITIPPPPPPPPVGHPHKHPRHGNHDQE